MSAAYDLQDAVTRLRVKAGENVIGYKVGCTGPGTKAQFGMNGPIRGTLFGNEAFRNDAVINPNEFCQLSIEGEMAVKVGEDGQIKILLSLSCGSNSGDQRYLFVTLELQHLTLPLQHFHVSKRLKRRAPKRV